MNGKTPGNDQVGSQLVDKKIASLVAWQAQTLSHVRQLIKQVVPDVLEDCKWAKATNPTGVPVWSYHGIICTGETYKTSVKLTFMNGASLKDPANIFNSSLDGNTRRAIDIREGEKINEEAFKSLIKSAVAFNIASKKKK
ncbi:MAG: DUF1801 domain-containing protein [Spongiibacteraceae bacterium]